MGRGEAPPSRWGCRWPPGPPPADRPNLPPPRSRRAAILTTSTLAKAYQRNQAIVEAQAEGLTHPESLVQTPYRMNCFNWVLGHLAASRDEVLVILGKDPVLGPEEAARYRRESDPVTGDGPGVLPLERLLAALKEGQERISAALAALPEDALDEEQQWGERTITLGARLHFSYFHDTYHVGQTELLRAVAGKTEKVI